MTLYNINNDMSADDWIKNQGQSPQGRNSCEGEGRTDAWNSLNTFRYNNCYTGGRHNNLGTSSIDKENNSKIRHMTNPPRTTQSEMAEVYEVLVKQLKIMERQELRAKSTLEHEQLCKEWKTVGFIADRLFLVIAGVFCVVNFLVILFCRVQS